MTELVDQYGYPTKTALEILDNFVGTPKQMIDYISSIWWPPDVSYSKITTVESYRSNEYQYEWHIATCGWSGNEEIVSHLENTFFWFRFWEMSRRGGGYTFMIPEQQFSATTGFLGNLNLYPWHEATRQAQAVLTRLGFEVGTES